MNTETKDKIESLKEQIQTLKKEQISIFNSGLTDLIGQNSEIDNISISINNHEFNDGDETYWALNYEDITITFENGDEFDPYDKNKDKSQEEVYNKIIDYFRAFDVDNFLEMIFSEYGDNVTLKLDNGKISYEQFS